MKIQRPKVGAFLLFFLVVIGGCASVEKPVDLTYEKSVRAAGGTGEILLAHPAVHLNLKALPGGRWIIGKAGDADIVVDKSPSEWLLSALVRELSAAGYDVKTVDALPPDVSKGLKPAIFALRADQSSKVVTIVTSTDVKLEAEVWKDGRLVKTLSAGAQDQEEGMDRSSEPIRSALEETLQRAMKELIPDIVKGLE